MPSDAGFKSRVRYINVLDPTNMCYYVSEILDAGKEGPLFMVSKSRIQTSIFIFNFIWLYLLLFFGDKFMVTDVECNLLCLTAYLPHP